MAWRDRHDRGWAVLGQASRGFVAVSDSQATTEPGGYLESTHLNFWHCNATVTLPRLARQQPTAARESIAIAHPSVGHEVGVHAPEEAAVIVVDLLRAAVVGDHDVVRHGAPLHLRRGLARAHLRPAVPTAQSCLVFERIAPRRVTASGPVGGLTVVTNGCRSQLFIGPWSCARPFPSSFRQQQIVA